MINPKEIYVFLVLTIIFAATISFFKSIEAFLYTLIAIFFILLINILAKKIMGFYLDSEIELNFWEIKRYGFKAHDHFKKPFPAGIVLPIIVSILSLGNLIWMASLIFDVKVKTYRAAKRHGLFSYSEITEDHIGFIAAAGVFANLFFAIIGYLIGFPEFSRLNIYFAIFNLLPISDLDGNKIFFGNKILWGFLATVALIGLAYALFLI